MRHQFIRDLVPMADRDPNIWLLTGDLGYGVIEPFVECFPERFVNCGVAEQNMVGVAAGLALSGKHPFVYSISNFFLRALEQIRNDVCYHELNVVLVGTGGGSCYETAGFSHQSTEELAIMRCLPNLTVMAPGSVDEVKSIMARIVGKGPCYLRLGKPDDWGARR